MKTENRSLLLTTLLAADLTSPALPVFAQAPAPSASPLPVASPTPPAAPKAPTLINGTLIPQPTTLDLGGRKLTVSGFVQARYEAVPSGSATLTQGGNGTGNGYNGNYLNGTNGDSFKIREARIAFASSLSRNTKVLAEFGTPGAYNVTAAGTQQVYVRRLYGQYTFGDGSAKYPTLTVGQFFNPFGFAINQPRPLSYQPERPLAFNEGANGLFANQEEDRGVKLEYAPGKYSVSASLINGSGTVSNDENRGKDTVLRAQYHVLPQLSIGASGYFGTFSALQTIGSGASAVTAVDNTAKKELYGLDAQYISPAGPFAQAEYVNGKYEALPPYAVANAAATPPVTLSALLPGNKVEGYYLIGGWTFAQTTAHPWSLIAGYDVFKRRTDTPSYEDENLGFGGTYNVDRGLRLRAYYITPSKVAHAPNVAAPRKLSLLTLETEFLF